MDWPSDRYHKPVISPLSPESIGTNLATTGILPANLGWPSANFAIYIPFVLGGPYLVRQVWWANGTIVSGNIDVGVYTSDGTRLFSAGSTAQTTVSVIQSVDITDYLLTPGSYYMAMVCSATGGRVLRWSVNLRDELSAGVAGQASALPLPATATLASTNQNCVPLFGITSGTVL